MPVTNISFPITTSGAALDETSVDNIFSYYIVTIIPLEIGD